MYNVHIKGGEAKELWRGVGAACREYLSSTKKCVIFLDEVEEGEAASSQGET